MALVSLVLSGVAVVISIYSILYTVWKESQETADAGNAWRAKRRLEEAILAHLRTLNAERDLRLVPAGKHGSFLARSLEDLISALQEARIAGLPRVLAYRSRKETKRVDYLAEWVMLEEHVASELEQTKAIVAEWERDRELPSGQAVFIMGHDVLTGLAPLSRREIRKAFRRPLELSNGERVFYEKITKIGGNGQRV